MSGASAGTLSISEAASAARRDLGGCWSRVRGRRGGAPRHSLFLPARLREDRPLLVAVHGISRNAGEHARRFARHAAEYGAAVLAPRFGRRRFPDYQRLGRAGRGDRADLALLELIEEVRDGTGVGGGAIYLFGFSGGAQFAHRFSFAYPERVARMAVAAAGWYTFPDPGRAFPRGVGSSGRPAGVRFSLPDFLRIPTLVLVGEEDTERDSELRQTRRLDFTQGRNRVERAQRWVAELQRAADRLGLAASVELDLLPGSDHSFTRCDRRGDLTRRVCEFFFAPQSVEMPTVLRALP